jgi:calcineurin-like phosphoesterase family protein
LLHHPRIEEIRDYKTLRYDGNFYVLFHYEIRDWDKKFHGSYHLFGHSHSPADRIYDGLSMDVGIDGTGYELLTIEEITQRIDEQYQLCLEPEASPRDQR